MTKNYIRSKQNAELKLIYFQLALAGTLKYNAKYLIITNNKQSALA